MDCLYFLGAVKPKVYQKPTSLAGNQVFSFIPLDMSSPVNSNFENLTKIFLIVTFLKGN